VAEERGMTPLRRALGDYLAIRRALGYKLDRPEKLLGQFIEYLEGLGCDTVTTARALEWACLPANGHANWWAQRLSVVRGFATYLRTLDPATEVPSSDLVPRHPRRASPYLYSEEEIAALIDAASGLSSPLRVATIKTLIGLLAVSGMRVGEAIRLDCDDVDLDAGVIVVRHTKYDKTRELPLHPTTAAALRHYLRQRPQLGPPPRTRAVFISTAGTRLRYCNVQWTFQRLVGQAGLTPRSGSCRPRIHDLRHSFAVATLLDAYRAGDDVEHRLTQLSTYLGHVHPGATYWYLSSAPELLSVVAERLSHSSGAQS
jgi:integrase